MRILEVIPNFIKKIVYKLIFTIYNLIRSKKFKFNHTYLSYENSFYNTSFFNERSIELPIVNFLVGSKIPSRVLEIGNVLNYYNYNIQREVIDKYEIYPGVINVDIEDFNPNQKYNLIFSISTLEHVGLDAGEKVLDPAKLERSLDHIINNLLKEDGILIVTLPLNYNSKVDNLIFNSKIFNEKFFMVRDNFLLNTWKKLEFNKVPTIIKPKPFMIEKVFFGIYSSSIKDGTLER